jgi:hypothetical protein
MLCYKKLNVVDFEIFRSELEKATASNVEKNLRQWDLPYEWFKDNTPLFYDFIESRKKLPIRLCRFYLTPINDKLNPHIDGLINQRSTIGLNIPIIGYENTTMDWYDCPDDNLIDGPFGFNKISASKVVDFSKLKKIDSTTIDCITFVRTDIVHGVTNFKSSVRLVLSLRFPDRPKNFEDAMELLGL